jgi:hypothetical protein
MTQHLSHGMRSESGQYVAKDLLHMAAFIANRSNAQNGQLAIVEGLDLRYGDIEVIVEAIFDATNHLPFVFQAPRFPKKQTHAE